jgi:hypothetical protein
VADRTVQQREPTHSTVVVRIARIVSSRRARTLDGENREK